MRSAPRSCAPRKTVSPTRSVSPARSRTAEMCAVFIEFDYDAPPADCQFGQAENRKSILCSFTRPRGNIGHLIICTAGRGCRDGAAICGMEKMAVLICCCGKLDIQTSSHSTPGHPGTLWSRRANKGCECPCATEKLAVPYCSDLDWFPRSSPGLMSEDLDTQTPGHPGLGIQRETGQPTTQTPTNAKTPHSSNSTHPGVTGERTDAACDG